MRRLTRLLHCAGIALMVVGFVLMFFGAGSESDPFLLKCMDAGVVFVVVGVLLWLSAYVIGRCGPYGEGGPRR